MKKVVSATLAGALAVGMVPAMALADDTIELQAQTDYESLQNGTLVFDDGLADGAKFVAGSDVTALVPVGVIPQNTTDLADVDDYTYYRYDKASKTWNSVGSDEPENVGKYYVQAESAGFTVAEKAYFEIVPADIEDAVIYQASETNIHDISDTEFVYDGRTWGFYGSVANFLGVKMGDAAINNDVDVVLYAADGKTVLPSFTEAGTYYVKVAGAAGSIYETDSVIKKIELKQFDLANAAIVLDTIILDEVGHDKAEFPTVSYVAGLDDISKVAVTAITPGATEPGKFTATVSDTEVAPINNIIGSKTVDYYVVNEELDLDLRYEFKGGHVSEDKDADVDYTIDRSNGDAEIDFDNFVVFDWNDPRNVVDPELITWVVQKKVAGLWVNVDASELTNTDTYGTFRVSAMIHPEATECEYVAYSQDIEFEITNGTITTSTVAFTYLPWDRVVGVEDLYDNGNPKAPVYDGTDVAEDIKVTVRNTKGAIIPESDYEVVILKNLGDKLVEVDEMVDAGEYWMYVTSDKYYVEEQWGIKVTVKAVEVQAAIIDNYGCSDCDATYITNYTGNEIDPILGFFDADGNAVALEDAAYSVEILRFTPEGKSKPVAPKALPETFEAAGEYVFIIRDADLTDNYVVDDPAPKYLCICSEKVYTDVPSDAWYADEVWKAEQNGYMTGYKEGHFFGPNNNIKRGDVALVLFRMAGAESYSYGWIDNEIGFDTPFADVEEGKYYAEAIAWCDAAGIMTGYGDGTNFGPEDEMTREQVATALYRYWNLFGEVIEEGGLLASALDGYNDADEISKYAIEAMEWAVEEGVFGVNTTYLNPGDEITRAEFAAVTVRLQPEGKLHPADLN